MARMAGAAASRAAVRVDPADAGIGPRRGVELAVGQNLDGRTVALEATDGDCRRTAEHRAQEIIERGKDLTRLGVMTTLLLVDFLLVASAAILRRYDHVNHRAVVLECTWVVLVGLMAIVTIDAFLAVCAVVPLLGQARVHWLVAPEALCAFRGAPHGARTGVVLAGCCASAVGGAHRTVAAENMIAKRNDIAERIALPPVA